MNNKNNNTDTVGLLVLTCFKKLIKGNIYYTISISVQ